MVDINIGNGQGITQAIRDKIGAANIKNKDVATWQKVVAEVNSAQNSKSIFKSGDNYTTDSTKLNEKSTYQSNFVVDKGTVTIDDSVWSKIQNLLTGGNETTKAAAETKQKTLSETANENTIGDLNLTKEPVDPGMFEKPNIAHVDVNPQPTENLATGKQLTRMVNGEKKTIEISHDKDGNKVRYAVNGDGTRGEELVTLTTTGKNTYQTKSELDKTVRSSLGLKDGQNLPDNLKPFYVEIGGSPQLMFKSDNGTLTPKQAAAYCKQHIAQGNKFSVQNNKLVPVKTSQEPVQTYGKHGNLNVDNDSSGGPFIKRGILDLE